MYILVYAVKDNNIVLIIQPFPPAFLADVWWSINHERVGPCVGSAQCGINEAHMYISHIIIYMHTYGVYTLYMCMVVGNDQSLQKTHKDKGNCQSTAKGIYMLCLTTSTFHLK